MKRGYLSEYFEGIGMKRISAVEADVLHSNQHEFNGVTGFKAILGEPQDKVRYPTRFLYLGDDDQEPITSDGFLTWYDARQKGRVAGNTNRSEYRLYFPTSEVSNRSASGDLLVIGKRHDGTMLAVIAKCRTTSEQQLLWLFGLDEITDSIFTVKVDLESTRDEVGFAAKAILDQIGVVVEEDAPDFLEQMLTQFGGGFPKTFVFSDFARRSLQLNPIDDPDLALVAWMEREELLFKTLERHLLAAQIRELQKVEIDTDSYMKLFMSFQQRRKSRAGSALENHMEEIFSSHRITYTRTGVTERGLKPDFIFPGISNYRDPQFPATHLTMVAAKTTCKDRWRQILNEAARIPEKHLLTLEPSISQGQTDEMKSERVQLVLPQALHETYAEMQRGWLMSLADLLAIAKARQSAPRH